MMQADNPFKGPRPYEAGDPFYGREEEISELHKLIRNEALTLLFSRSGTGKSSLIKAGLMPFLKKQEEFYPIYIHLPYVDMPGVADLRDYVIQRCREEVGKLGGDCYKISMETPLHANSLFEFIHCLHISIIDKSEEGTNEEYPLRTLLIFDQFEEIFVHPFKNDQLEDLYDEIRCLVENEVPKYLKDDFRDSRSEYILNLKNVLRSKQKAYRIMFAFREEYLPQFESLKRRIPSIKFTNSRYRLEPFSVDTSANIIVKTAPEIPVSTAKTISESLAAKIIGFEQEKVDPFLLSIVCQVIYPQLVSQKNLSEKDIKVLVDTAVENYLEKVYQKIGRPTKKFIEKKLITSEGAKNSVNYNEVKDDPDLKHDIDELITNQDYRLLSKGQFLDYEHISILHDRLLPPLQKRRRKREAAEKRNESLKVVTIAAIICGLIGAWFVYKNATRNKILTAFAYNQIASDEAKNDPTVALRIAQMAYQKDSNTLIVDAFRTAALENALYKTIIHGDSSDVFISCAVSNTGDSIVTGCANGSVILWRKNGELIRKYRGFNGNVNSIAISPDGKRILAGSADSAAKLYDVSKSEEIQSFHSCASILAVAFSPDGTKVLAGSNDSYTWLWDVNDRLIDTFRVNYGSGSFYGVTAVAFSPDGSKIVAGLSNYSAVVWRLNPKEPTVIQTQGNSVGSVAFSPDGSKLAIGSAPGIITIFYLDLPIDPYGENRNPVAFQTFSADVRTIAFSPDGTKILTGSSDHVLSVTDLLGKPVKVLKGHTGSIFYAQFSGKKIITCATDTTVRLWTIPEMEDHQKDFFDYEHPITSAALSPDGRQIVTGSGNGIGELWNVNGGLSKEIFKITNPIGPTAYNMGPPNFFISSVCFSPKGKSILTTSWDGIARIWPFINENTLGDPIPISKLRSNIISAVFSRGGDSILTVSSDGTANLWRVNNLSQPLQSYGHNILSAALSPDGTEILASYNDSTARLWSIKDSTRKKEFTSNPKSKIFGIAFSTDGQLIITGSEDKIARLWGRDQKLKKQLIGHLEKVSIVAFSADGTKIITGSDDGFIRLWQRRSTDWNNGDSIMLADKKLYLGVPAQINSLVLLDDGKSLLSSSGNMARLWDINLSQSEKLLNDGKLDAFINQFNEMSESQKEKYRTRAEARLHK